MSVLCSAGIGGHPLGRTLIASHESIWEHRATSTNVSMCASLWKDGRLCDEVPRPTAPGIPGSGYPLGWESYSGLRCLCKNAYSPGENRIRGRRRMVPYGRMPRTHRQVTDLSAVCHRHLAPPLGSLPQWGSQRVPRIPRERWHEYPGSQMVSCTGGVHCGRTSAHSG